MLVPAGATAGLLAPLAILDRRMQSTGGPGIIPFELAGPERSSEILRRWGAEGRRAATASLLLDFTFLVAYTSLNLELTRHAHNLLRSHRILRRIGPTVAAVQVAAGACDAVENAALLGVVARGGEARLASIARVAARTKFAGLLIGCLYGAIALASTRKRF